jgi:hypothetical protein
VALEMTFDSCSETAEAGADDDDFDSCFGFDGGIYCGHFVEDVWMTWGFKVWISTILARGLVGRLAGRGWAAGGI